MRTAVSSLSAGLVGALLLAGCSDPRSPTAPGPTLNPSVSSAATTYSGRATVLQATVDNLPQITLGDTGPLPESGGALDASLLTVRVPGDQTGNLLDVTAEVGDAETVGQGNHSRSEASVAELNMTVAGNSIAAGFLESRAAATCGPGGPSTSGSSEVVRLVINNNEIAVTGKPNQEVPLPNGKVVINEQSPSASGNSAEMTVSALHVTVFNPLGGGPLVDVVIARAHADISCGACSDQGGDFVTGGGWITPSGAKANFGVAGGIKNGSLWGHLTYIDHGPNGPRVRGTGVSAYSVTDATTRHIEGMAEINGQGGFTYTVDVADNGEPGGNDTFALKLSNGYVAAGPLAGGNIQLHGQPAPCQ